MSEHVTRPDAPVVIDDRTRLTLRVVLVIVAGLGSVAATAGYVKFNLSPRVDKVETKQESIETEHQARDEKETEQRHKLELKLVHIQDVVDAMAERQGIRVQRDHQ